jgi:hypothetical protein
MAMFNFVLVGCSMPQPFEVASETLFSLGDRILVEPFVSAETLPDEYGQVRRVLVRANRILLVSEAE